ncbi:MAG: GPW/gp25 family protein [Acidobacteria bacterium]|nr:GPW/gp25 family protein [Acidobacteriota bacterium]
MANPAIPPVPIGWPLLGRPDAKGRLRYPSLDESVRQSIRVILQTRPGEQLMHPEFGAGLENFLHEPNTILTRRRIRDAILESLAAWEPRILVDRVDVSEDPASPSSIRAEIAYRLRRTGAVRQMGLTLQLEE